MTATISRLPSRRSNDSLPTARGQQWKLDAACTEIEDADLLFFPDKGGPVTRARQVCAGCPVRIECLTYAQETRQQWGIWGGLSEAERLALRRKARP